MKAIRLVAVLVTALGVGACGGSDGENARPPEPRDLVLTARDLPAGFVVDRAETGRVTNGEVAASREPGYEEKLESWGRRDGYTAHFERRRAVRGPLARASFVESRASVYIDADGAADSFEAGLAEYESYEKLRDVVSLGDETHAFRTTAVSERRPVEFIVVAWRTGTVLSTIVVAAPPGRVRPTAAVPLARAQEDQVQRALDS